MFVTQFITCEVRCYCLSIQNFDMAMVSIFWLAHQNHVESNNFGYKKHANICVLTGELKVHVRITLVAWKAGANVMLILNDLIAKCHLLNFNSNIESRSDVNCQLLIVSC